MSLRADHCHFGVIKCKELGAPERRQIRAQSERCVCETLLTVKLKKTTETFCQSILKVNELADWLQLDSAALTL